MTLLTPLETQALTLSLKVAVEASLLCLVPAIAAAWVLSGYAARPVSALGG